MQSQIRISTFILALISTLILSACANDDALYAPWPKISKNIDTTDYAEMGAQIALGQHDDQSTSSYKKAKHKKCVTNSKTLQTTCTVMDDQSH